MSIAARRSHRGDEYQLTVAVHWIIKLLLDETIMSVQVDAVVLPGESDLINVDDIVIAYQDGTYRFIQAKKNQTDHKPWQLSDSVLKDELKKARSQLEKTPTGTVEFCSRTPFDELAKLIEGRLDYPNYSTFTTNAPSTLKNPFAKLAKIFKCDEETTFALLQRIEIGPHHDYPQWEESHRTLLENKVTDVDTALDVFTALVRGQQSGLGIVTPLQQKDVLAALEKRGVSFLKGNAKTSPTDLRALFHRASTDLLSWRTTLPDKQWLDRPELDVLLQRIEGDNNSLILLLGEPGCGKSALLARLGQRLQETSIPVLAIKADFLPETVKDQNGLQVYLDLPDAPVACIRELAQLGKVVVLLDQLDALADLVVQHSDRLRVPLDLICDLADIENIHIVASCRVFEHRHDTQLRNLNAIPMTLMLPTWEQVAAVLSANGIQAGTWNETMREDLRSPHALNLFLELIKITDAADLLQGYQQMLEVLWRQNVLCDETGKRRRALINLAEQMGTREVLWLPLALFEDCYLVLQQLESVGILVEESGRIGFRHQTLYEFVRAKTFLEESGRLTETVVERQQSLRVRPLLWHALGYMRGVDRGAYLEEIERLWKADLRRHLRTLLIEFLGQLQDPAPREAVLFFNKYDDLWYQGRILTSIIGSRGWFKYFAPIYLPILMAQPAEKAWQAVPILTQALAIDNVVVLQLLDAYWMPYPEKDKLSWRVLEATAECRIDLVDRFCRILARTDIAAWAVNHLTSMVSAQLPEQAPRLIATWLQSEWTREIPPEPVTEDLTADHFYDWRESPLVKRCRALLEGHELHDLPAVAEAAPGDFIAAIWPWFLTVMEEVAQDAHPFVIGYRESHCLINSIDDDHEIRSEQPFLTSFVLGIEKWAELQPESFLEFAKTHEGCDLMIVQRLLAKGLTRIASQHPDKALDFLCADPRRMKLGSYRNVHSNTQELIRAVSTHLDENQFLSLEKNILEWNHYSYYPDDDAKTRHQRFQWCREHRLRLLKALPRDRISDSCRRHLEEEERAFPQFNDWDVRFSDFKFIGSPVSAEQMQAGRDEDILNLFAELTDESGWDHPRKTRKSGSRSGGAIQAGRELARLAEIEPEKAVRLIRQMKPGQNEIPVSYVIEALAKTNYEPSALYALIMEFSDKGFSSEHFRLYVAWAIEKIVDNDHPLPETLFALLENWLTSSVSPQEENTKTNELKCEKNESLLWGHGVITTLPQDNYPTLAALSAACLRVKPPASARWLNILERHLSRNESPQVWSALCRYLQWLNLADRDQAENFLNRLFMTYPSLFEYLEGIFLLAYCQHWISPELAHYLFDKMCSQGGSLPRQGMGELLMLRRVLFPEEQRTSERLDIVLSQDESALNSDPARIGIAHAVAHLWREPLHRYIVHGYLLKLIQDQDDEVLSALAYIFSARELHFDQASRELLDALCLYPAILRCQHTDSVGECLLSIVDVEPERVSKVCHQLLDQIGNEMNNISSSYYFLGDALVSIALRLQELGKGHQSQGADLFERILEFNAPQAKEVLTDLDKRTPNVTGTPRVSRRKWKKP
ncbi:MAG: hypothetical protein ACU84H_09035 [Gammaproteobacteria bacterium]